MIICLFLNLVVEEGLEPPQNTRYQRVALPTELFHYIIKVICYWQGGKVSNLRLPTLEVGILPIKLPP